MLSGRRQVVPLRPGTRERRPRVRSNEQRIEGMGLGAVWTSRGMQGLASGATTFGILYRGDKPFVVLKVSAAMDVAPNLFGAQVNVRVGPGGMVAEAGWNAGRAVVDVPMAAVVMEARPRFVVPELGRWIYIRYVNLIVGAVFFTVLMETAETLAGEVVADPFGSAFV